MFYNIKGAIFIHKFWWKFFFLHLCGFSLPLLTHGIEFLTLLSHSSSPNHENPQP
jgi:hypothetical protein